MFFSLASLPIYTKRISFSDTPNLLRNIFLLTSGKNALNLLSSSPEGTVVIGALTSYSFNKCSVFFVGAITICVLSKILLENDAAKNFPTRTFGEK